MGKYFFWVFTLAVSLLIPGSMIFFGRSFMKNPPGEINGGYGCRTSRSMRNRETWNYANEEKIMAFREPAEAVRREEEALAGAGCWAAPRGPRP